MPTINWSRRQVLVAGASWVGAAVMPSSTLMAVPTSSPATESASELPAFVKLSLAGYSFRQFLDTPGKPGKMSLLDLADLCAQLGLDAIEPTSYYFLRTDDDFIYALKRRICKLGLEVSGLPINTNFATGKADEQLSDVRTWIDISVKLGSPNMRIFAGRPDKNVPREKAFDNAVPAIKQACDAAGAKGVFLALENHGYLTETAEDVLKLVEAVDHPWLGVNLDTGNFSDKPYDNMKKLVGHAIVCQAKTQVAGDQPNSRVPADYQRILEILRDARYRGYLALEYEGNNPHQDVPSAIAKLQAACKKILA